MIKIKILFNGPVRQLNSWKNVANIEWPDGATGYDLCDYFNIDLNHHRADIASLACAQILLRYIESGADPARYIRTYPLA